MMKNKDNMKFCEKEHKKKMAIKQKNEIETDQKPKGGFDLLNYSEM